MASMVDMAPGRARVDSPHRPDPTRSVKSADRAFKVLEFFDDVRRPAPAGEIAAFFGFPQSSTSQLLRSMLGMGYLQYDAETRCYSPSARVSLLGSWCDDRFVGDGAILRMMKALNRRTRRAVWLASHVGTQAQYIHVLQSSIPERPHVTLGMSRPLAASGAGIAILSTMPDATATRYALRNNAERAEDAPAISIRDLLATLEKVRQDGFVYTISPGIAAGVIAAPLAERAGQARMAICLGDYAEPMERDRDEMVVAFREELAELHLHENRGRAAILSH